MVVKRKKQVQEEQAPGAPLTQPEDEKLETAEAKLVEEEAQEPEEAVARSPLTHEERRDLEILESVVEKSLFSAAQALWSINKRRLYRETHDTFEEYCRARFQLTPRNIYYKIKAAEVFSDLKECERPVHILPTSEYQVRPLSRLKKPEQRVEVWLEAVEQAGGNVPSHDVVQQVVKKKIESQAKPQTEKSTETLAVGDVCLIKRTESKRLQGKIGCWGIVKETGEEGCTIQLGDRIVESVAPSDLKSFGYPKRDCQRLQKLCDQMSAIYSSGELEETAEVLLGFFGRLKEPKLTSLQENLLKVLEREYLSRTSDNKATSPEQQENFI
ncbi:MAG: hypothetical protein AB4426_23660 [Xenococcaceae cyanobacterium]